MQESKDLNSLRQQIAMPRRGQFRFSRVLVAGAGILLILVTAGLIALHHFWPFTEAAVRNDLEDALSANVSFRNFHNTYFPPGCVAEDVVFRRSDSSQPLIAVRQLTIRSNLFGMLHHHVSLIRAEGAYVNWQKAENKADAAPRPTVIDRLVANDAVLEISRRSPHGPLRFAFHKFEVTNLRGSGQSGFSAEMDNPMPRGALSVSGRFGPWNKSEPRRTELEGSYALDRADLGVFHSIEGLISSRGDFKGTFDNIGVHGKAAVPVLTVASTQHGLPLNADFDTVVNGATGDVIVREVTAQFGKDELNVHGTIGRKDDGRRVANFDIDCQRGRIEDTFYPFIHSPQAAIIGAVKFRMHVTIPPGKEKFDEKIGITSAFDIEDGHLTHQQTRHSLSKIAEAPHQEHPDDAAPTNIQGAVSVSQGIARFSELTVRDQDAAAKLEGTFNLLDQRVNLHGQLKTAASLTKTTHGIKTVFAKVIEPFFKKKPHETVVPVKITGTYHHPQFGLDLSGKM